MNDLIEFQRQIYICPLHNNNQKAEILEISIICSSNNFHLSHSIHSCPSQMHILNAVATLCILCDV